MNISAIVTKEKIHVFINEFYGSEKIAEMGVDCTNRKEFYKVFLINNKKYGEPGYEESLTAFESWELQSWPVHYIPEWLEPRKIKDTMVKEAKAWAEQHLHIRKDNLTITSGDKDEIYFCNNITIIGDRKNRIVSRIRFSHVALIRDAGYIDEINESRIDIIDGKTEITSLSNNCIRELYCPANAYLVENTKIEKTFDRPMKFI